MAQCNIEALANQFEKEMFLSDDSETDDESDKDYESDEDYKTDKAIEPERRCVIRVVRGKDKDIIKCMWKTVLNHERGYMRPECLASTTLLVCTINGVHKPIIFNDLYGHAEETLITYLKTNYKGPMKLTIYINNSPCASCASSLKLFLEENLNIQLILHVTHLYKIIRKSCKLRAVARKCKNHIQFIKNEDHEKHYRGLRDLMSLGGNRCRIESFTKEVWEALLAVMNMSEESRKRIMRVYGLKLENYDRSRQGEDRRIRKDLNHIKSHSDPWHDINKNDFEEI